MLYKSLFTILLLLFLQNNLLSQAEPDIITVKIDGTDIDFNEGTYYYSTDVNLSLGETFTVYCKADNDGDDSPAGYNNVTYSFPDFTNSSDIYNVSLNTGMTSNDMEDNYLEAIGNMYNFYYPYLLVESSDDNGWDGDDLGYNENNEFTVNVEPENYGNFIIYLRVDMSNQESWSSGWNHNPSWSPYTDMKGMYVYKIVVDVINENSPPSVSRYSPSYQNVTVDLYDNQSFTIEATDSNGDLDEVKWYLDGSHEETNNLSGSYDTDEWDYDFNTEDDFVVKAKVYDDNNNTDYTTWNVTVVDSDPTISKVYPTSASVTVTSGESIQFKASVYEPDGEEDFDRVEWRVNGTLEETDTYNSWSWSNPHTSKFTNTFPTPDTYTVQAKVFDKSGDNSSTEWNVTATPDNYPPGNPSFVTTGPNTIYPTITTYTIIVDYTDPDGGDDIDNVFLRFAQNDNEGDNRLTMGWGMGLFNNVYQFGDETQVLKNMSASKTSISNGYRITWEFEFDWNWTENSNVDLYAFSEDDSGEESNHTKNNKNAYYENDIIIYSSNENNDPVTAGEDYIVTGSISFEGTSTQPEDWNGISTEMRKSSTSGELLDTDGSVSNGYSLKWETEDGDEGDWDVYILPINSHHQPPSSSTYWDSEDITIEPDLLQTRIKESSFEDITLRLGESIECIPNLQKYQNYYWSDLSSKVIYLDIDFDNNNEYEGSEELGYKLGTTEPDGTVYWLLTAYSNDFNEGTYNMRVRFDGDEVYDECILERALTIIKPNWLFFYYMSNEVTNAQNPIAYTEAKFQKIASQSNNNEYTSLLLWDHYDDTNEDLVYLIGSEDWENDYTKNLNCWNASAIGLTNQEFNMGSPLTFKKLANWAINTHGFEADNYAVVYFNHGSGVIPRNAELYDPIGFGADDGDALTVDEFGQAILGIKNYLNQEINILHMDACLMQMFEVAYELNNKCNFLIGNVNLGWATVPTWEDYFAQITSTTSPLTLATSIADEYTESLLEDDLPFAVSILNINQIDDVISNFNDLSSALINNYYDDANNIETSRLNVQTYDTQGNLNINDEDDDFIDLKDFCDELVNFSSNTTISEAANDLSNSLQTGNSNFIIYESHNNFNGLINEEEYNFNFNSSNGISMYFPRAIIDLNCNVTMHYQNYQNTSNTPSNLDLVLLNNVGWDEFLELYFDWQAIISDASHIENLWSNINIVDISYVFYTHRFWLVDYSDIVCGSSWQWDNNPVTIPDNVIEADYTNTSCSSDQLSDGIWYFHIKNIWEFTFSGDYTTSETTHFGPIKIDQTSPNGQLTINNNSQTTTSLLVNISVNGTDNLSGISEMKLSNNGTVWTTWLDYASTYPNWNLASFGGNNNFGQKTVYLKLKDNAGNQSETYSDDIIYAAFLDVNPPEYPANHEGGSFDVSVYSNIDWSVSESCDWVVVAPQNGSGDGDFTVQYEENQGTEQRVCVITVSGQGLSKTVTLYQAGSAPYIIPTPSYKYVSNEAGSFTVDVISNISSWSITPNNSWLSVSQAYGNYDDSFDVTYEENNSSTRTGTITLSGSGVNATVTVEQEEAEELPVDYYVQNEIITSGETKCYNATNNLYVAGSGTSVTIEHNGSATFIAGNSVFLNPGFYTELGSYVDAHITTNNQYCQQQSMVSSIDTVTLENTNPLFLNTRSEDVLIYPNPTNGKTTIDFLERIPEGEVRLYSSQGTCLMLKEINNQSKMEIDCGNMPDGLYAVKIITNQRIITAKIIKNR